MHQLTDNLNIGLPTPDFRPPNFFRRLRRGISIIEVMTAVVVAMIGVFGTLVLIPFAVKQAQSGLDLDDARNLAVNSRATFEVMGLNDPDRWVAGLAVNNAGDDPVTMSVSQRVSFSALRRTATRGIGAPPRVAVMLDPIWANVNRVDLNIGASVDPDIRNNFGFFGDGVLETDEDDTDMAMKLVPSTGGTPPMTYPLYGQVHPVLPDELRIPRLSMTSGADSTALITPSLAQRLFQSTDALNFSKFDTDDGDLAGQPFQIFDRDAAGNILSRQTDGGRLSQAMFVIPGESQQGGVYRRVTLVFADRTFNLYENPGLGRPANQAAFDAPNNNVNLRSLMLSAMVTTRGALPGGLPSGFQGGEIVICPVEWGGGGNPMPNQTYVDVVGTPEAPGVRRDDWVMMINQLPTDYPVAGVGLRDRQQIQFYRVANIDEGNALGGTPNDLPSLTLDGPAFDFGPEVSRIQTYIVHLRDVVNIFEDSITL